MDGISIIICTYNGKNKLEETLLAIMNLKASCTWELIIVDNASNDQSGLFSASLLKDSSIDWRVLKEIKPGLLNARLCGLRASKYDFLLYCDDDNILDENYLKIGYNIIKNNLKLGALGGSGIPVFETTRPYWFDQYSHSFAVGPQANLDGKMIEYPSELYGAGIFFRKKPLLYFLDKGFKSVLSGRKGNSLISGEDVEWCYLVQLAGYDIWYDHSLKFKHLMPNQRMNWEYYLRLKQGISSSVCRLLSYHCIFMKPKSGLVFFSIQWFKRMFFSSLIYLKLRCIYFLRTKESSQEELLSISIWRSKAKAYWSDCFISYNHFKQLKQHLR